jgi:DNA-binding beta-propeller fold protein YncE
MKTLLSLLTASSILFVGTLAHAFTTTGFSGPYGIVVDPATNFIYVSNVNGEQDARDDNGFISRLKGDGTVDQLKYVDGAGAKVALSAPKGMAIAGTTLYVADIDKLHAFDLGTGAFLFDVNFGDLPVQHFYDVRLGPDTALYVSDGPGNTIYRVDIPRQHEVTIFAQGDTLGQPHGLAWYPLRQAWVVAGWSSGHIIAFDRERKRLPLPAIFLRTLEGIEADENGNLFVASTALSAVYRLAPNFVLNTFQLKIGSPAGVALHRATDQILVASFDGNTVQSYPREPEKAAGLLELPAFLQPPPGMSIPVQKAAPAPEEQKPDEKAAKPAEKAAKPAAAATEPKKEEAKKPAAKKEEAKAPEAAKEAKPAAAPNKKKATPEPPKETPPPPQPEKKKGEALEKVRLPGSE